MTIYFFCNLKPKTYLSKIINKNFLKNKLIKLAYKFTKSIIKIDHKVGKPNTYKKAINNLIYRNR